MLNLTVMLKFYILDQKYHFWANSDEIIKIVSFCPPWGVKYPFWQNFFQKIKIVSLRNSLLPHWFQNGKFDGDVQIFSFGPETSFWVTLPKNQSHLFKLKFGTWINLNMLFGKIWSKKFKIVHLRWNFLPMLIKIWSWC